MRAMIVALALAAGLAPAPAATSQVSVRVDPTTVSTSIGQRFPLISTVRNHGDRPVSGLVADGRGLDAHFHELTSQPG